MPRPKILVVDDEPKFLFFLTELLTGAGYDVRGTEDPFSVISLAVEFVPSLILLDLSIPGKDGLELAKELRKDARTAKIPLMFLTAQKAGDASKAAKDSGAVAYLEKPIQSSSLLWMIRSLLENATPAVPGSGGKQGPSPKGGQKPSF